MRSGCSATGNNSFNSLVGTGSNKHVVGLDAVISLFSSSCPIVVKHCSFSLGTFSHNTLIARKSDFSCNCSQELIFFFLHMCLYLPISI